MQWSPMEMLAELVLVGERAGRASVVEVVRWKPLTKDQTASVDAELHLFHIYTVAPSDMPLGLPPPSLHHFFHCLGRAFAFSSSLDSPLQFTSSCYSFAQHEAQH